MTDNEIRLKEAKKATLTGFILNLFLSIGKVAAGILGNSAAMLADGVHSLSDFITDVIVLVCMRFSAKDSDKSHTYGHGKYETFATLLIAIALFFVGTGIFMESVTKLRQAISGEILPQPGSIALWAAFFSILTKEWLFRYTLRIGKKINSQTVIANGWHHRSDAFSSIGTAFGIAGAIFLGEKWRILDPLAGLIVSFFILRVTYDLAKPSIDELLEKSLPDEICDDIVAIITSNPEVKSFHKLKNRRIGNGIAVDVHIQLDRNLSFEASHQITHEIEKALKDSFGPYTHTNIHAEPVG
ncbi:MAG: cation diffusion facilitator family transporter [Bacteroidales bacterium]